MLLEMTRATQAGLRQERQFEAIANHLANSGTTGFKKDVLSFDGMMKATLTTDFTVGDIQPTGNPLDLALSEKGFFKIQTPFGIRYTRNGNFTLNTDRQIVTGNGEKVLGENGPITVPGSQISINEAGQVFSDENPVGTLSIVNFDSYAQLKKESANNFRYDGNLLDEKAAKPVKVVGGALEGANISVVNEMAKMVESNRLYDTISKMMMTLNELDGEAITSGSDT